MALEADNAAPKKHTDKRAEDPDRSAVRKKQSSTSNVHRLDWDDHCRKARCVSEQFQQSIQPPRDFPCRSETV